MARQWSSNFFETLQGAFAGLLWHDENQIFAPPKGINGAALVLDPPMASIIEVVGANTYICEAAAGTLSTDSSWRVSRVNVTGGVTTITWADGGKFSQVAANRTGLAFS